MIVVVKGLNYTKVETARTIQFWHLRKERKQSDCGVWIDGVKINSFNTMKVKREKEGEK